MKKSDKPTAYIIVKAGTSSEWDFCDFAIIHINAEWKERQLRRIQLAASFQQEPCFQSLHFFDDAVSFFKTGDNQPGIDQLLGEKQWVYIDLEEGEWERLTPPGNQLERYTLVMFAYGTIYYESYCAHTGVQFWTDEFKADELCTEWADMMPV